MPTTEQWMSLHRQVLCNETGGPMAVDYLEYCTDTDREGKEKEYVVFGGTATGVLVDPNNPGRGARPIDFDDGVVVWEQKLSLSGKADLTKSLADINRAFRLKDKLVDTPDEPGRFFDAHERSVAPAIRATPVYVAVSVRPSSDPEKYGPTVYFNVRGLAERGATSDPDVYARYKANRLRAEAEAAPAAPF